MYPQGHPHLGSKKDPLTLDVTFMNIFCFSYILKDILPKITTQFESLKPSFTKIDRMEDLICRVNADFDVLGNIIRLF